MLNGLRNKYFLSKGSDISSKKVLIDVDWPIIVLQKLNEIPFELIADFKELWNKSYASINFINTLNMLIDMTHFKSRFNINQIEMAEI